MEENIDLLLFGFKKDVDSILEEIMPILDNKYDFSKFNNRLDCTIILTKSKLTNLEKNSDINNPLIKFNFSKLCHKQVELPLLILKEILSRHSCNGFVINDFYNINKFEFGLWTVMSKDVVKKYGRDKIINSPFRTIIEYKNGNFLCMTSADLRNYLNMFATEKELEVINEYFNSKIELRQKHVSFFNSTKPFVPFFRLWISDREDRDEMFVFRRLQEIIPPINTPYELITKNINIYDSAEDRKTRLLELSFNNLIFRIHEYNDEIANLNNTIINLLKNDDSIEKIESYLIFVKDKKDYALRIYYNSNKKIKGIIIHKEVIHNKTLTVTLEHENYNIDFTKNSWSIKKEYPFYNSIYKVDFKVINYLSKNKKKSLILSNFSKKYPNYPNKFGFTNYWDNYFPGFIIDTWDKLEIYENIDNMINILRLF